MSQVKKMTIGAMALFFGATACGDNSSLEKVASQTVEVPPTTMAPVVIPVTTPTTTTTIARKVYTPKPSRAVRTRPPPPVVQVAPDPSWDAIKEEVARCESGGRYDAQNPRSTASGKYQFLDSTWAGRYGVKSAHQATPEQQEEAARELHAARGLRPWKSSQRCWR